MGKVTKFNYSLDDRLIPKFNKMIERCTDPLRKKDSVLIIEGKEGTGKTTYSVALAYYISAISGREFGAKDLFFTIEDLIEAFQNTTDRIFIWDEPALQMLSRDRSALVMDLTRLLMMARKNRHFLIINIAHFNKFNDYLICDRPVGMLHVFEIMDKQGKEKTRAYYIPRKNLRKLWDDYKRRYKKNYFIHRDERAGIHVFPDVLNPNYKFNVLSEWDNDLYEKNKSEAIKMIGKKDSKKDMKQELAINKAESIILEKLLTGKTYEELCKREDYPLSSFQYTKKNHITPERMDELKDKANSLGKDPKNPKSK